MEATVSLAEGDGGKPSTYTKNAMPKTKKVLSAPLWKKPAAKKLVGKAKGITRLGQHPVIGQGCISTLPVPTGGCRPCPHPRIEAHLPYCKGCMKSGDPSLKKVKHPKFGSCLVATRALKRGYLIAWWGRRIGSKRLPDKNWEWALTSPKGVIDAVPFRTGSLLQFSQCPGPTERATVNFAPQADRLLVQKDRTCRLFRTLCDVPKGHQITMTYSDTEKGQDEFFADRGITRADIGCKQWPALKKPSHMKKAGTSVAVGEGARSGRGKDASMLPAAGAPAAVKEGRDTSTLPAAGATVVR